MRTQVFRHPTAVLPIAMSVAAFLLVIGHIIVFGAQREPDEGTAAHIWQLLMAGQLPVIGYFAIRWLPEAPLAALQVLAVQGLAIALACFPVHWFNL